MVYLFCMFDISTNNKQDRTTYRAFREYILKQEFIMFQYSIYYRVLSSTSVAREYQNKLEKHSHLINGTVACLIITQYQFQNIKQLGKSKKNKDKGYHNSQQLTLL